MPTCELCGADTGSDHKTGYVQGVEMILCNNCYKMHAKSGSDTSSKGSKKSKSKFKGKTQSNRSSSKSKKRRKKTGKKSRSDSRGITEKEIIMDYGEKVRNAREKENMTQEDLGKKINEKSSVIHRIESEHMEPSISLARKLERELEIKLIGKEKMNYKKENDKSKNGETTLGDIANIKKS